MAEEAVPHLSALLPPPEVPIRRELAREACLAGGPRCMERCTPASPKQVSVSAQMQAEEGH